MSYLNWKEAPIRLDASHGSRSQVRLNMIIRNEQVLQWVTYLEAVYLMQGEELRMDLSDSWILFWKLREDGNKVLVAHPQSDQWVATVALESSFGERLLLSLKKLEVGQSLILSQLGQLNSVSNLELLITLEN